MAERAVLLRNHPPIDYARAIVTPERPTITRRHSGVLPDPNGNAPGAVPEIRVQPRSIANCEGELVGFTRRHSAAVGLVVLDGLLEIRVLLARQEAQLVQDGQVLLRLGK